MLQTNENPSNNKATMDCYAVFEGGGIKGIAFAGAITSATKNNIHFIGYGGASAGAVIAFLATIGYSGSEIKDAVKEINFENILEKSSNTNTKHITKTLDIIKNALSIKKECKISKGIVYFSIASIFLTSKLYTPIIDVLKKVNSKKGIHNTSGLKKELIKLFLKKNPEYNNPEEMTFSDHYRYTKIDLKILATDLETGSAIEFSVKKTPNEFLFDCLVASCSYPVFFEPSYIKNYTLVDGGLSCNLPTYLFHNTTDNKIPIYAFDLQLDSPPVNLNNKNLMHHISSLVHSSLDASNTIISQVVGGISIPIKVPKNIDTLKFSVGKEKIDDLYTSGYDSAEFFFKDNILSKLTHKAKTKHDVAKILYGDLDFLLSLLINDIDNDDPDNEIKAWIYCNLNHEHGKILTFAKDSNKSIEPSDYKFSLDEYSNDCVETWNSGLSMLWGYDSVEQKTRICVSIKTSSLNQSNKDNGKQLAVLCISINNFYDSCYWLTRNSHAEKIDDVKKKFDIAEDTATILLRYAYIIRNAMLGNLVLFQSSIGAKYDQKENTQL